MTIRDICVPLFPDVPFAAQLEVAADFALRFKAHVNVVFTRPDPAIAAATIPEIIAATGVVSEAIEIEGIRAQNAALEEFERWRTAYGLKPEGGDAAVEGAGAAWHHRVGTVGDTVVDIGRVCDLAVISQPNAYEMMTEEAFAAAVFETGCPTLITPNRVPQSPMRNIVVAWNGTLQAARALRGAMPMLREADTVSIFAPFEDPQTMSREPGPIEYLSRHGVSADCLKVEGKIDNVGKTLLETADTNHATMIVMGAYSHSRIREAVLGGVTRHVLRHAEIPVLMMH
jgi:nucleotide-binding universal stress UspA family protein